MPVMLSIVMPVFNEGPTLAAVLDRMAQVAMPVAWELIIVDDGSVDGAVAALPSGALAGSQSTTIIGLGSNRGKGRALREGLARASGTMLGVQDADLEYDPADIPRLIAPLVDDEADVVFGVRSLTARSVASPVYAVGNRLMSWMTSIIVGRRVADAYTCYKFFRRDCYDRLELTAEGFEIEAELAVGLLRRPVRFAQVPVGYVARTRDDGKKIRLRDGLTGVAHLLKARRRQRRARPRRRASQGQ